MRNQALYACAATLAASAALPVCAQSPKVAAGAPPTSSAALAPDKPLTVYGRRPGDEELVVRVSYADLQLSSSVDASALQRRVVRATSRACSNMYRMTTPTQQWVCRDMAMDIAQPQIDLAVAAARQGYAASASARIVLAFAVR